MRKILFFCLIVTILALASLMLWFIFPVFIRMDDSVDLGSGYYYVQDYPQCICRYPKPGKVVLPICDKEEIVVRVQYNDSVIIAVCSPYYYSHDSTVYRIEKRTGNILSVNVMIDSENNSFKEIKNRRRYKELVPCTTP